MNESPIPDPESPVASVQKPGLYVHVPFCSAICNYCNFNRGLFDEALKDRFVEALVEEIRVRAREKGQGATDTHAAHPLPLTSRPFLAPDTLYFGGGTPSLLRSSEIQWIINECRQSFGLEGASEITLEANPETVHAASLEGFRAAGVNRLSVGVQSFREVELQRLGRVHSAERARQAVALARAAGFDNVSIDLMMSLPGQEAGEWLASVEQAIDLAPDHLSLYILEVYPHLPLKQDIDRHGWVQPPDEVVAEMYETAMAMLEDAGYDQYEISNVCRPGRQSRHNLKYWSDGDWCGFGPGAHSTWHGNRWRNVSSTFDYIERVGAEAESATIDYRLLSAEERLGDALFMGLRLNDGIDLKILSQRYGIDVWTRFGPQLERFCEAGILLKQDNRVRLTRPGMLLANEVMAVFV